jgi:hypothetical protein
MRKGISKCRALYDYQANDSSELSFRQGDVISVLQKDLSGWWQGELHGKIGVFPAVDWVQELHLDGSPVTSVGFVNKCRVLHEYVAEADYELSIKPGDTITVEGNDEGWFYGTNQQGQYGRYPSNYVDLVP